MLWRRRRVPRLLRDRVPCDLEGFVGRHFPSGPRHDAARRLWRFIEGFAINLSGLHPDDELASLLDAANFDQLDALELFAALRGEPFLRPGVRDDRRPTFRDGVDAICGSTSSRPQREAAPAESQVTTQVSTKPQSTIRHSEATLSLSPRDRRG
jgi:hypothetical protein